MTILESRKITDEEYINEFQPVGVWLLVEKDLLPTKTGSGIILAPKGRTDSIRFSGTGVIRGIVPISWGLFEQPHDAYWVSMFKVGDRIGFSTQTPITSPCPPQWSFNDSEESMKFIQITVTDITGIFLSTEEAREEWMSRFERN